MNRCLSGCRLGSDNGNSLCNAYHRDVKNQHSIGRDHGRRTLGAIGQGSRDNKAASSAYLYANQSFLPSFNHLSLTDGHPKGLTTMLIGTVKFLAVCREPARVLDIHGTTTFGGSASTNLKVYTF